MEGRWLHLEVITNGSECQRPRCWLGQFRRLGKVAGLGVGERRLDPTLICGGIDLMLCHIPHELGIREALKPDRHQTCGSPAPELQKTLKQTHDLDANRWPIASQDLHIKNLPARENLARIARHPTVCVVTTRGLAGILALGMATPRHAAAIVF